MKIYDSSKHDLCEFTPLNENEISIYLCGPTVQGAPHIGHLRTAVAFDVFRRWFLYKGYSVKLITNITDIDDKIIRKSRESNTFWWQLAYKNELLFTKANNDLFILPPTANPRATSHMTDIINFISELIDQKHAYVTESGSVYFDVESFGEYGSLTNQTGEIETLASEEDASEEKKNAKDFALWKSDKGSSGEADSDATGAVSCSCDDFNTYRPVWDSPWGKGRPGWHIECSTIATKYLGDAFDIHGGGIDLRFPHHENEQAQARAIGKPFAAHWMHTSWITQKGEKMSKSLGNVLDVNYLINTYKNEMPAGVDVRRALRLAIASVHYRSMIEWQDSTLLNSAKSLSTITEFIIRAQKAIGEEINDILQSSPDFCEISEQNDIKNKAYESENDEASGESENGEAPGGSQKNEVPGESQKNKMPGGKSDTEKSCADCATLRVGKEFEKYFENDFNVSGALSMIFVDIKRGNKLLNSFETASDKESIKDEIKTIVENIVAETAILGVDLSYLSDYKQQEAGSDNTAAILDALISEKLKERQEARVDKDYKKSDEIRDNLAALGITIKDGKDGSDWEIK